MALEVHTFVSGVMETNTYVLRSGSRWAVIDPGIGPAGLLGFLRREQVVPDQVLLTHGHCDHIAGINDVHDQVGPVAVWCPARDAEMLCDPAKNLSALFGMPIAVPAADHLFAAGDVLAVGETRWEALDTSGHTIGGVSLYCPAESTVFTGDALFHLGIGRADMPGGDEDRLLENIHTKLLTLPPETVVYPGHGPATTIGREAEQNSFLSDRKNR